MTFHLRRDDGSLSVLAAGVLFVAGVLALISVDVMRTLQARAAAHPSALYERAGCRSFMGDVVRERLITPVLPRWRAVPHAHRITAPSRAIAAEGRAD